MFTNSLTLLGFYLKRDVVKILIWFAVVLSLVVGFGAGIQEMYPDQESLDAMVEALQSPALKAMLGVTYLDGDTLTLGGMYAAYMLVWSVMIVGCMSVSLIVRHARADEERGRLEMIRSLPVGRLANLAAALAEAVLVNVVLFLMNGFGLAAMSDSSRGMDFAGAFAFAGVCAAFGIVMAGVTAIFCQLNKNPGTAAAFSYGFVGVLYMFFMAGAMQDNAAIYRASLLGLLQESEVYIKNDWVPVIIAVIVGAALCAVALVLCQMRDLGESLIPERPGRRNAPGYLKSPAGLAWRLLKNWVFFWAIMVFVLALAYGSVMGDIDAFIESNEIFLQLSQGNPMVLAATFLLIGTVISALPILHFILKVRSEEKRGFAENVLSRSATRSEQLRGYFLIALISVFVAPFLNAAGFWVGSSAVMEETVPLIDWIKACIVYTPALLVLLGVAVALIGWLPKRAGLAWGYLGYSFGVLYLGMLLLPKEAAEFLARLTPFGYVPRLPHVEEIGKAPYLLADGTPLLDPVTGEAVIMPVFADEATYALSGGDIAAMIVMTVLAAGLFVLGFVGYRRRDMM